MIPWPFLATALTALVSVLVWVGNKQWERWRDERQRMARIADVMRALRAEIRAYSDSLSDDNLERHWEYMSTRILEAGDGEGKFVPIVPRETRDTVYRALLPDLPLLPVSVVEPVVLYYSTVEAIANLAEDMRSERFAAINAERTHDMYKNFIEMKRTALWLAKEAYAVLTEAIGEDGPA